MIVTPEANSPRERLSAVVGDLAVLFASSVKCTASSSAIALSFHAG